MKIKRRISAFISVLTIFSVSINLGVFLFSPEYSYAKEVADSAYAPYPPSNVSVNALSPTSIKIMWTKTNGDELVSGPQSYVLYRTEGNDTNFNILPVAYILDSNATSYTDSGLTPDTKYNYKLAARNSLGEEGASTYSLSVETLAPDDLVVNLVATAVSKDQINLSWSWSGQNPPQFYSIERSLDGMTGWATVYQTGLTTQQDTGLQPDTRYYYRVKAFTNLRYSQYSNIANAKTFSVTCNPSTGNCPTPPTGGGGGTVPPVEIPPVTPPPTTPPPVTPPPSEIPPVTPPPTTPPPVTPPPSEIPPVTPPPTTPPPTSPPPTGGGIPPITPPPGGGGTNPGDDKTPSIKCLPMDTMPSVEYQGKVYNSPTDPASRVVFNILPDISTFPQNSKYTIKYCWQNPTNQTVHVQLVRQLYDKNAQKVGQPFTSTKVVGPNEIFTVNPMRDLTGVAPGLYKEHVKVVYLDSIISNVIAGLVPDADTLSPTVNVISPPKDGELVDAGEIRLVATAIDNVAVTKVEFYGDGMLIGQAKPGPYYYDWDVRNKSNGTVISITAKAYDAAGNVGISAPKTIRIDNSNPPINDTTPPTVKLTSPTKNGELITDEIGLIADATDNVRVVSVEFLVDGSVVGTSVQPPFRYDWSTVNRADGNVNIQAKAYDAAGNSTISNIVTARIENSKTPTPPPPPDTTDENAFWFKIVEEGKVIILVGGGGGTGDIPPITTPGCSVSAGIPCPPGNGGEGGNPPGGGTPVPPSGGNPGTTIPPIGGGGGTPTVPTGGGGGRPYNPGPNIEIEKVPPKDVFIPGDKIEIVVKSDPPGGKLPNEIEIITKVFDPKGRVIDTPKINPPLIDPNDPSKGVRGPLDYLIKKNAPAGTYTIVVYARDKKTKEMLGFSSYSFTVYRKGSK